MKNTKETIINLIKVQYETLLKQIEDLFEEDVYVDEEYGEFVNSDEENDEEVSTDDEIYSIISSIHRKKYNTAKQ